MINNPTLDTLSETTGADFFSSFFGNIFEFGLIIGSIIFVFMLIVGAIRWIGSGGDKGSVENAKGQITNALVGIVILFSVYAVAKLIGYFFGDINLLELEFTPFTGSSGNGTS